MLMMFNLDWKSCDIDEKVARASRSLRALIAAMGAGHRVQYDLTSLGAGETIFPERTSEKPVAQETIDFIRQQHAQARTELGQDKTFSHYQGMATMLKSLQGDRHTLVAIFPGDAAECQERLDRARLSKYFGEHVYGLDSVVKARPTLLSLFNQVILAASVNPHDAALYRNNANDAIIVDETEAGIRASRTLDVPALAYVGAQTASDEDVAERTERLQAAGARAIATTPQDLAVLPYTIFARPDERSRLPSYVDLPGAVSLGAPKLS